MLVRSLYASENAAAFTSSIASGPMRSMREMRFMMSGRSLDRHVVRVGKAVFVQVFDQILALVGGQERIVDRLHPHLLGPRVVAHVRDTSRATCSGTIASSPPVRLAAFSPFFGSGFGPCFTSFRLPSMINPTPGA